jgi:hypothetical protein
LNFSKTTR